LPVDLVLYDDFLSSVCPMLCAGQNGLAESEQMVIFCSTQKRSEIIAVLLRLFV